ncbi:unnamed protein product [Thlaspi arvense]|uniref:C-JID domain-containing protein n=1 Tax=Thlaspi arvense TaxID=13288 RepID=A0AAU9RM04_THLAR|nr:unnamed protein product [Thlaspi arvense]
MRCTRLESLLEMNLISLKILTLNDYSNFKDFLLIFENIESLYLDGTAISHLPINMEKLQRLVVSNMKNCEKLEKIPDRVGELKALQELINLKCIPEINMSFGWDGHRSDATATLGLVSEPLFSTYFPGCEVPSWFCHNSAGSELDVKLLPHWHDKRLAGIALCAVVSFLDCPDQISRFSVTCTFKVIVEDKPWVLFTCPVGSWVRQRDGKDKIESDHIFIGYTSCPYSIKCPEDESSGKCNSTKASLEFAVKGGTNENGNFKVLKCGLGLVYAKDKSKNSFHEAKYDMSFQETSKGVDGRAKKKEKTRSDDGRPKKKQKSRRDDNIQCQQNGDASVCNSKK